MTTATKYQRAKESALQQSEGGDNFAKILVVIGNGYSFIRDAAFELAVEFIDRNAADETTLADIESTLAEATIDERLNLQLVRRVWKHQSELATQRKFAEWKAARKNPTPEQLAWNDAQYTRFILTGE